jgi:hypothetical protein
LKTFKIREKPILGLKKLNLEQLKFGKFKKNAPALKKLLNL